MLHNVDVSADGKWLLTAEDNMFRIWDAQTGQVQQTVHLPKPVSGSRNIMQAMFTPDSKSILLCGGMIDVPERVLTAKVEVWDVETGKLRLDFPDLPHYATSIALTPDNRSFLVYAGTSAGWEITDRGFNGVYVYSLSNGALRGKVEMEGHEFVSGIRMLSDNVVETIDTTVGVRKWDLHAGTRGEPTVPEVLEGTGQFMLSPSQKEMVLCDRDEIALKLIDLDSFAEIRAFDTGGIQVGYPRYSPDGKYVAAVLFPEQGASSVRVWEVLTGQLVQEVTGLPAQPTALAFYPDNSKLLCGMLNGGAVVVELTTDAQCK